MIDPLNIKLEDLSPDSQAIALATIDNPIITDSYEYRQSLAPEERKEMHESRVALGLEDADEKGFFSSLGGGFMSSLNSAGRGLGATLNESGLGSGMQDYFDETLRTNQQWNPSPYDETMAKVGNTLGSAVGSTLAPIVVGTGVSALTGNAALGTAAGFATTFSTTFGNNVQRNRKAGYSEEKALGMAAGESLIDAAIENMPWGIVGKGTNALRKAILKGVADKVGKKAFNNFLLRIGTNAAKEGLGELGEEGLQYINQYLWQKAGGDPNAKFDNKEFIDNMVNGFIGGFGLGLGHASLGEIGNKAARSLANEPLQTKTNTYKHWKVAQQQGTQQGIDASQGVNSTEFVMPSQQGETLEGKKSKIVDSYLQDEMNAYDKANPNASVEDRVNAENQVREKLGSIEIVEPKSRAAQMIHQIGNALGLDVTYYAEQAGEVNGETKSIKNGFVDQDTGKIYLNALSTEQNPLFALGHEFKHHLDKNAKDIAVEFDRLFGNNLNDEGKAKAKQGGVEFFADQMGHGWTTESMWKQLVENGEASKEGFGERLLNEVANFNRVCKKFLAKFANDPRAKKLLKDIELGEKLCANAVEAYMGKRQGEQQQEYLSRHVGQNTETINQFRQQKQAKADAEWKQKKASWDNTPAEHVPGAYDKSSVYKEIPYDKVRDAQEQKTRQDVKNYKNFIKEMDRIENDARDQKLFDEVKSALANKIDKQLDERAYKEAKRQDQLAIKHRQNVIDRANAQANFESDLTQEIKDEIKDLKEQVAELKNAKEQVQTQAPEVQTQEQVQTQTPIEPTPTVEQRPTKQENKINNEVNEQKRLYNKLANTKIDVEYKGNKYNNVSDLLASIWVNDIQNKISRLDDQAQEEVHNVLLQQLNNVNTNEEQKAHIKELKQALKNGDAQTFAAGVKDIAKRVARNRALWGNKQDRLRVDNEVTLKDGTKQSIFENIADENQKTVYDETTTEKERNAETWLENMRKSKQMNKTEYAVANAIIGYTKSNTNEKLTPTALKTKIVNKVLATNKDLSEKTIRANFDKAATKIANAYGNGDIKFSSNEGIHAWGTRVTSRAGNIKDSINARIEEQTREEYGRAYNPETYKQWVERAEEYLGINALSKVKNLIEGDGSWLGGAEGNVAMKLVANTPELFNQLTYDQKTKFFQKYNENATNAGRLLNSLRNSIKYINSFSDAVDWINNISSKFSDEQRAQWLQNIFDKTGIDISTLSKAQLDQFAQDQKSLDQFLTKAVLAQPKDVFQKGSGMLYEAWINGLLSGIRTHGINAASNLTRSFYEMVPKRMVEATINALTGNRIKGAARFGEFKYMWKALFDGGSWRNAIDDFNRGMSFEILGQDGKIDMNMPQIPGKLGKVVRVPGRFLKASDNLSKGIIAPMEAISYAYRLADDQGLKGQALEQFIQQELSDDNSASNQYGAMRAKELTFTDELKHGGADGFVRAIISKKMENSVSGAICRLMFPFIGTPYNITKQTLRMSPLGLLNLPGEIRSVLKGDGKVTANQLTQHIAEQVIGMSMLCLLCAGNGDDDEPFITGTREGDTAEGRWKNRNIPATSIRIGDQYYDYSRLEPVANVLASIANIAEAWHSNSPDRWQKLVKQNAKHLVSKSYLSTLNELVKVLEGDEYTIGNVTANLASSAVPNIVKQLVYNTKDEAQETKGTSWTDKVLNRSGFKDLPAKVDIFGRTISKDDYEHAGRSITRLSPTSMHEIKTSPADKLLRNYNKQHADAPYFPDNPKNKVIVAKQKIELTPEQYYEYAQGSGQMAHKQIENLIRHGALNVNNPTEKDVKKIKSIITKSRQKRLKQMYRQGKFKK